jgi:hypothetical protein
VPIDVKQPTTARQGMGRVSRRTERSPRHSLTWTLVALAVCLAAAAVLCVRAWGDPLRSWAGVPGDPYKFMNFLGWYPHAIAAGQNPFHNTSLNPPGGVNMMWDTTMPLPALVFWPVGALWGQVATYNAVLVAGLTLSGWCSFIWLRRHVVHPLAAIAGALVVELGPYVGTRAIGHLNLVLVFAVPLLLIAFEEIFVTQRWSWSSAGALGGAAAAAQLLCAEELLAVFGVMALIVLVLLALSDPGSITRARLVHAARALVVALAVFLVIAGYPLYFQFFGTAQVHGAVQSPERFSDDLVNLFVPNGQAWLQPRALSHLQADAGLAPLAPEANAYVGIPMLLMSLFVVVRWRRDRTVVVAALAALAAFVLSLGPRLHVAGHLFHHGYLPGWLVAQVPVLGDILPGRFGLAIDLALALLFTLFVDRHVLSGRSAVRSSFLGAAATVALATVLPSIVPVSYDNTPAYFSALGEVTRLPRGSTVLVVPYYDGSSMLWQARSGYRFTLVEGLAVTAQANGRAAFFALGPVTDAYSPIEASGEQPPRDPATRSAVLGQLRATHTVEVVIGPMPYQAAALDFTSWLLGRPPVSRQGVYLWHL